MEMERRSHVPKPGINTLTKTVLNQQPQVHHKQYAAEFWKKLICLDDYKILKVEPGSF